MENFEKQIAQAGLKIKAIKLNSDKPFLWTSGYQMPIYNDNRMFLFYPEYRKLIIDGFFQIIQQKHISCDIIAGMATAGIPYGILLANKLNLPFIYIREAPRKHGLKNQIEGMDAKQDFKGSQVVIIEELVSTGSSVINAIQAIRNANGIINSCLSVFNYGFDKTKNEFDSLNPKCEAMSLLTYDTLLKTAKEIGYLTKQQTELLQEWRNDPFGWGEKHGFPKTKINK